MKESNHNYRHCRLDGGISRFDESVWYDYPLPQAAHPIRVLYVDRFCGQRKKQDFYTIHPHWEFIGVVAGNGWLESENAERAAMVSNAIFLIPPRVKHIESAPGQMDLLWIGFELTFAPGVATQAIQMRESEEVLQKMLQLWQFIAGRKPAIGLEMEGRLLTLIGTFLRFCNNASQPAGVALAEIPVYLNAHLAADVSVEDLAQMCRMSRSHFSRQFRLLTGVSPNEYLLCRRLEAARNYLQETNLPINQIAKLCGFNSAGYLGRIFHARYDCPPGEFRSTARAVSGNERIPKKIKK